jgi:hypothetical protein
MPQRKASPYGPSESLSDEISVPGGFTKPTGVPAQKERHIQAGKMGPQTNAGIRSTSPHDYTSPIEYFQKGYEDPNAVADTGVFGPKNLEDLTHRIGNSPVPTMIGAATGNPVSVMDAVDILSYLMPQGEQSQSPYGPSQAVTRFLNRGTPNKTLRELSTSNFVKDAGLFYGDMFKEEAKRFASKYPRVAAHMNLSPNAMHNMEPISPESAGITSIERFPFNQVDKDSGGTAFGPTLNVKFNQEIMKDRAQARETLYHEGTHTAQALGNKDMGDLYMHGHDMQNTGNDAVDYRMNPWERSAFRRGIKEKIGMSDVLYKDFVKNPALFSHHPTAKANPQLIMPRGGAAVGTRKISNQILNDPNFGIGGTEGDYKQFIAAIKTNGINQLRSQPPKVGDTVGYAARDNQGKLIEVNRTLKDEQERKEFEQNIRVGRWLLKP